MGNLYKTSLSSFITSSTSPLPEESVRIMLLFPISLVLMVIIQKLNSYDREGFNLDVNHYLPMNLPVLRGLKGLGGNLKQ